MFTYGLLEELASLPSDLLVHLELGSGKDVLYGAYLTTISKKDYATYIAQDGGQWEYGDKAAIRKLITGKPQT